SSSSSPSPESATGKISSAAWANAASQREPSNSPFAANSMAPFLFPAMLQANAGGGQHSQFAAASAMLNGVPPAAVSGLRIYIPEAYCELFNKEICNKYFLKSHKANKHGIYNNNNGNGGQSASSNANNGRQYTAPASCTSSSS